MVIKAADEFKDKTTAINQANSSRLQNGDADSLSETPASPSLARWNGTCRARISRKCCVRLTGQCNYENVESGQPDSQITIGICFAGYALLLCRLCCSNDETCFAAGGFGEHWFAISPSGRPHDRRFDRTELRSVDFNLSSGMTARIQIRKHEALPGSGSFEVRFADGRESVFFYFDDVASRRLQPELLTSQEALEQAKALARAERGKGI